MVNPYVLHVYLFLRNKKKKLATVTMFVQYLLETEFNEREDVANKPWLLVRGKDVVEYVEVQKKCRVQILLVCFGGLFGPIHCCFRR